MHVIVFISGHSCTYFESECDFLIQAPKRTKDQVFLFTSKVRKETDVNY